MSYHHETYQSCRSSGSCGCWYVSSSLSHTLSPTFSHILSNTLLFNIAVVQSTDKNFLVPVGGAIVNSPSPAFLQDVAKMYPGRANMSPIFDLFVTFLAMGEDGLVELWTERQRLLFILQQKLQRFAEVRGKLCLLLSSQITSASLSPCVD